MPDDVTVRRAERRDREAVQALWARLLAEQAAADARFAPAEDAARRWENDFPHWVQSEGRRLVVAEQGGAVVGFASASRWYAPPVYEPSAEVLLEELYVVPEARRRGVGRALWEAVRRWAGELQAPRLRLVVLDRNRPACAFWEAVGAVPFSRTYTYELEDGPVVEEKKKTGRLGF